MSGSDVKYDLSVGRWEPDARGRLEVAALELYEEHGFEQTTVAEIAERAGLTERTFFRHYADKREVLFGGSETLERLLVSALVAAPADLAPLDAVIIALEEVAGLMEERRTFGEKRFAIINANSELQERELIKLARLSSALTATLCERGVKEPLASLAAEAGMAVFRVAYERWITGSRRTGLASVIRKSAADLRSVAAT